MVRTVLALTLLALLAACAGAGGATTDPSADASTGGDASTAASAPADASGAAVPGEASTACAGAFAGIDASGVESLSDLVEVDGVEATVTECESIGDWIAGAGQLVEDVNPNTAELLLGILCDGPGLSSTDVCREIASS